MEKGTMRKPLRLWPGVVAAVLLLLVRFGVPVVAPGFEGFRIATFGGFVGMLAIVVWWTFLSRAPRLERWGALAVIVVALVVTWRINHESMGLMWCLFYAVPILCLALVAWAVATRRLADGVRRATLIATILIACGVWTAVRMEGLTGDHTFEFAWRFTETGEERLLADVGDRSTASLSALSAADVGGGWRGFRGPGRDSVIPGVRIETDWSASAPIELWRRPIGPGWSSFAVHGNFVYTQEQRGEDELVTCYDANTGEPLWTHRDAARFFDSMGGAGPRATPTLSDGRVYAVGATGILNVLDATDGALLWSRNVAADTESEVPIWGFSSSPLVLDDSVIVAAGGMLVAYDLFTGDPRWVGPDGGPSYSSPHRLTIDGVAQIVLLSDAGATSVAPADGALLWEHPWPGASLIQPAVTADGDVLISAGEGKGVRRIGIAHGPRGWTVEERWTSNRLKPNFNDFVVHDGHAFGFDGSILACIDVDDGERKWKGGRYGHGQLVLLPDQDVLLVLSEQGELALVAATPDRFTELARFPAIAGKTWNHPVLVGDLLLVRNGREMAAFRLALAGG
jgi:outer membrane protein assembly factor BamB